MDAQVEIVQTKITQGNNSLHVTAQAGANVTINQSRTDDSPLDLLLKVGTPLAALAATFFIHRSTQQRIDESKEELQAEIHHRLASKTPILGLIPGKDDSYSSVWLDMANGSFIHGEKQEPHEGDPGYPVTFSLRDIIPGTRCWVSPDVLVVPCDEIRIEGKDKNGEGTFFTFLKSSLTLEAFRLAEPPHWALLPDKERENGICLYLSNGAIIDGIVLEPSSDDPAPPVFFELHNIPEDLLCYAPPEVKIANRDGCGGIKILDEDKNGWIAFTFSTDSRVLKAYRVGDESKTYDIEPLETIPPLESQFWVLAPDKRNKTDVLLHTTFGIAIGGLRVDSDNNGSTGPAILLGLRHIPQNTFFAIAPGVGVEPCDEIEPRGKDEDGWPVLAFVSDSAVLKAYRVQGIRNESHEYSIKVYK